MLISNLRNSVQSTWFDVSKKPSENTIIYSNNSTAITYYAVKFSISIWFCNIQSNLSLISLNIINPITSHCTYDNLPQSHLTAATYRYFIYPVLISLKFNLRGLRNLIYLMGLFVYFFLTFWIRKSKRFLLIAYEM